jgi:hypothetical protein
MWTGYLLFYTLIILLQPDEPMVAVVAPSMVDFMAYLLSTNDYVKILLKIKDPQDSSNLLDFIFYVSPLASKAVILNSPFCSFLTTTCSTRRG